MGVMTEEDADVDDGGGRRRRCLYGVAAVACGHESDGWEVTAGVSLWCDVDGVRSGAFDWEVTAVVSL